MSNFIRYRLNTKDRPGVTSDVLTVLKKYNVDLKLLEVKSKEILIKIDKSNKDIILNHVDEVESVESIEEIKYTDSEMDEINMVRLIDSIDEGIMSVDENYKIVTFNNVCEEMFFIDKSKVINKDISEISSLKSIVKEIFEGKPKFDYRDIRFEFAGKSIRKLVSCRKIMDNNEKIVGVTFIFKIFDNSIRISVLMNEKEDEKTNLIGKSKSINKIRKYISIASDSNSSVMILGESGTGKEVVAKEIVYNSERFDKPFVSINCAALPDDLIESELFGYKRGAFTGANNDKKGLFMEANHGTLFLDEIGEMGPLTQAKLLRVLQENKVRRVGSTEEEEIDVRIICATNRNLEEMVKEKKFREDLYYRLNVLPIKISPLRERKEDIPLLVTHFISVLNKKLNKNIEGYSQSYINKMMEFEYRGNVRELKNVVERSINLSKENILTSDTIYTTEKMIETFFEETIETKEMNYKDENSYCVDRGKSLKESVEEMEKKIIEDIMKNRCGSIRKTAKELKISHTTLINKCKKYGIEYLK
ncbi:sigma-54 interaction domain-containing protein [Peptostreptococcus russellii]|uniref:sigma-54 interaction domain-containing protein n=1 Tax=Peptostreptococcus russellii TaxID=215200 RepID=UPI002941D6E0|nr:sigma 54-interacting transcriptional regulator [Peptostreptococcus russellii]